MNAREAYGSLARSGLPLLKTNDAAAIWKASGDAANKMLGRMASAGLIRPLRHGIWWIRQGPIDPFALPEYLSAPYPSYVSLQSALQLHGVIEQIPGMIFAVSLGRTRRLPTSAGVVSLHHMRAELFEGYETGQSGTKLASLEKALFDTAYLSQSKLRWFASLPELRIPKSLDRRALERWIARVRPVARQTRVRQTLQAWHILRR